jgi:RNA-directed DNA polymerase
MSGDAHVRFCERLGVGFLRATHLLLFGDDKAALHQARRRIEAFLLTLRLTLHPRKTRVFPVATGVPFLGFVHAPGRTRLRREAVRRAVRRLRRYRRAFASGTLPVARLSASVRSWVAHAAYGQTYRLRARVLSRLAFSRAS